MDGYRYERADERWRRTDTIEILSIVDTEIAYFPLAFVQRGGNNTWQFVLDIVRLLVVEDPVNPGHIFTRPQDGAPVDLSSPPRAGTFHYIQEGMSHNSHLISN